MKCDRREYSRIKHLPLVSAMGASAAAVSVNMGGLEGNPLMRLFLAFLNSNLGVWASVNPRAWCCDSAQACCCDSVDVPPLLSQHTS